MKLYINWEKREWYTNKYDIIDDLVSYGILYNFSDWLETDFRGCFDELLELSGSQKKRVKEDYQNYLKEEFERINKNGEFGMTILEIDTENFSINEL